MTTKETGALPDMFVIESGKEYHFQNKTYDIFRQNTVAVKGGRYFLYDNDGVLDVAFYLRALRDVTLDFGGARLILHGRVAPFIVEDCENIRIQNVTVEYDRSFYTEFDIIERRADELVLAKKEKFPCRVENGYLITCSETWKNRDLNIGDMFVQGFDSKTGEGRGLFVGVIGEEIVRLPDPPCEVRHLRVREENGYVILQGDFPNAFDTGVTLVITPEPRDKNSVYLYHCKNTVIRNYRILNGAAMGIASLRCENITLDGVKLFRDELSHGIVTNLADAVHLNGTSGTVEISDCVFESMIDDALNVHGNYFEVTEVTEEGLVIIANKQSHQFNFGAQPLVSGDKISVKKGRTMDERGVYNVAEPPVTLDRYHLLIPTGGKPNALPGDMVENITAQARLHIKNCIFDKANSHLRIQTGGRSVIEDCRISLPLLLTGDMDYWSESSAVTDLTIKNCRFCGDRGYIRSVPDISPTKEHPYYHTGIKISDCVFDRRIAFDARQTGTVEFTGNTLTDGSEPEVLKDHGL